VKSEEKAAAQGGVRAPVIRVCLKQRRWHAYCRVLSLAREGRTSEAKSAGAPVTGSMLTDWKYRTHGGR